MRLGQTSVVFFLSRITASLLGFGATLYFARELGAEPLGTYSLVLGVVSWLSIAGAMGIPAAVTKRVSEGTDREEFVAGGVLLVGTLVALLLGIVAVFRGQLNAYVDYPAAGFVALILVVSLLMQLVFSTMQGLHLVHLKGFLSPLRTGVRSGLQIGVLALGGVSSASSGGMRRATSSPSSSVGSSSSVVSTASRCPIALTSTA